MKAVTLEKYCLHKPYKLPIFFLSVCVRACVRACVCAYELINLVAMQNLTVKLSLIVKLAIADLTVKRYLQASIEMILR